MQIEGDFSASNSLPQLMDSLCKTKRTGILRFSDKVRSVKVFLKNGDAVYASGPKSASQLGHVLQKKGLVSSNSLKVAVEHARSQKIFLPQALLDKECIDQEALHEEIKALTEKTMADLFSWKTGHFAYADARFSLKKLYPHKEESAAQAMKTRIANSVRILPPMPQVIHKARKIMADPKSDFKQLAQVLEKDQGIAGRILRRANSPYYGMAGKVASIDRAMVVLGHQALSEIISMASISMFTSRDFRGYSRPGEGMWWQSIAVAIAAKSIAEKVRPNFADEAFAAGLLHDCGKMVLDKFIRESQDVFDRASWTSGIDLPIIWIDQHCP